MNVLILVDRRIGYIYQAKVRELFDEHLKDYDGGYYVYPLNKGVEITGKELLSKCLKNADIVLSVVAHKGKKVITAGDLAIDISLFE